MTFVKILRFRMLLFWIGAWFVGQLPWASCPFPGVVPDEGDVRHLYPITQIAIGFDSHTHVMPYLLGWLENIDYPKGRLRVQLYIVSKDDTAKDQATWWMNSVLPLFSSLLVINNEKNWMEAALRSARISRASRILLMDGSTIPLRNTLIQDLDSTAVVMSAFFAPILDSDVANCIEVNDTYRSREVQERIKISEPVLPMLVNVDLMDSSYLSFDANNIPYYNGSYEPLKVFAESARRMNIDLWIDNLKHHGLYIDEALEVDERRRAIRYMLADLVADGLHPPTPSHTVRPWAPDLQLWDVEKIYMINLKRRPERRARMEKIFSILGVDVTYWEATDGRNLPSDYQYHVLPGYLDPFHKRPIKAGEIGCFLSHYRVWRDVLRHGLQRVIVFEDDLRFSYDGLERIREVLEDLDASKMDWDLIYLGRKKQGDQDEVWVSNHRHLSTVGYSYWTLGYILSAEGARRLLYAKPLRNLLPVDEYFPIMFDKHPNKEWSARFPIRNLRAFTLYPLVVFPQRYTNQEGYISDTEDSVVVVEASDFFDAKLPKDEL